MYLRVIFLLKCTLTYEICGSCLIVNVLLPMGPDLKACVLKKKVIFQSFQVYKLI